MASPATAWHGIHAAERMMAKHRGTTGLIMGEGLCESIDADTVEMLVKLMRYHGVSADSFLHEHLKDALADEGIE
jgi:hypothetical protein